MKNIYILFLFIFSTFFSFSQTFSSGNISVAIPDDGNTYPGGGVCNTVNVSGIGTIDGTSITISSVCIYIEHTYNGDLDIYLVSPAGTEVPLSLGRGGGGDDFGTSIGSMCFDMYASASITTVSSTGPITGSYKPEGSFSDFNSESANGNWQLCVGDDYASDSGNLLGWSVTFGAPPAPSCSDGILNQDEIGIDCGGATCPACGLGDDVCNPVALTVNSSCNFVQYTNVGMTESVGPPDPGCASFSGPDIWFSITVPTDGHIILDQNSGVITDAGMAVYSGANCNALTLVDCDDDGSANASMSYIELTGRTAGETLWVRVWEYGGNTQGTFSICAYSPAATCTDGLQNQGETGVDCGGPCAACPVGMTCATPEVINAIPYNHTATTCGFESDYNSSDACGSEYMNGEDFVFEYTPVANEFISAAISNTTVDDMGLFVLNNCPDVAGATCVYTATSNTGAPTICYLELTGGQTYYFIVATKETYECTGFTLNIALTALAPDTITTCAATFYDSGGATSDYSVCENNIVTYCPSDPNLASQIDFTAFDLDASDILCVYDGMDTTAMQIDCFTTGNIPTQVIKPSYLNTSGCLTFHFQSNDVAEGGNGWTANAICSPPCQSVEAYSTGGVPFIDICQGDIVHFEGLGIYNNNDEDYHQDDATSSFEWTINNEIVSNLQDFYYVFPDEGGYDLALTITDNNGCRNLNDIQQKVRVSLTPSFAGTEINPTTTCSGYSVDLTGVATPAIWNAAAPVVLADTTFLPDGSGDEYTAPIFFNSFTFGQTLEDVNDVVDICLNIEHSYLGDLDVYIECPNGSTAMLFDLYTGSGTSSSGAFLGEPLGGVDHSDYDNSPNQDPTVNLPGSGYDYCFNMTGSSTINNLGTASGVSVPSDTYIPIDSYDPLVGCPLNGTWSIHVIDNILADNGYIFNWSINFDESLYPAPWSFEPSIPNEGVWTGQWLTGDTSNNTSFVANNNGTYDYVFTVVDNMGCVYDTTLSVEITSFGIDIAQTDVSCNGECDGSINLTINNATSAITFIWSNAAITEDLQDLCAGVYTFTATDAVGCFISDSIVIIEPDSMLITLESLVEASCNGACDGEATISVSGGQYPYTYSWGSTGITDSIATGLCSDVYTVNITDAGDCKASISINVTEPQSLSIDIIDSAYTSCNDTCDGFALSQATFGTTPYTYLWSNGELANQTNILCDGWAFITVTDANGCTATDSINIQEPTAITATSTLISNAHCEQEDGSAEVTPTGGTSSSGNYSYNWGTGVGDFPTTATNSGLASGAYNVTINDDNGCFGFLNILIQDENGVIASVTDSSNTLCFGSSDGSATVSVIANQAPDYTYTWLGHASVISSLETNTVSNLAAGLYSITVTDANNCNYIDTIRITEPLEVTATLTDLANVSCYGLCNGEVTISPEGGTPPYTYLWSNGSVSQTRTNLCKGVYVVTIYDSNMCEGTIEVNITQPEQLLVNITSYMNASCFGNCDGTALAEAIYGTSPYTYLWSNSAGSQGSVNHLCANTYTVTATDANSCTATAQIIISAPSPLQTTTTVLENAKCYESCDGEGRVDVVAGTGTAPYFYFWENIETSQINESLCAGVTQVTIYDSHGCIAIDSISISQPLELTVDVTDFTRPSCHGYSDGSAIATAIGGTGPYSYIWNTGTLGANINNIGAGNYTVNVTDGHLCIASSSQMITAPGKLKIIVTPTEKWICQGMSATFYASRFTGGTAPYDFVWSTGDTTEQLIVSPTQPVTGYSVYGIDGHNCLSDPLNVSVKIYPAVSAIFKTDPQTICPGDTLTVSATITGGQGFGYTCDLAGYGMVTPPFKLSPDGDNTTVTYVITSKDFCGSPIDVDTFDIYLLPTPPNVFSADTLAGCPPLNVNFNENSPFTGEKYNYRWNFNDGELNNIAFERNPEHTFENPGSYDITLDVKSQGGCTHRETKEAYITVYQNPTAKFSVEPGYASIIEPIFNFTNNSLYNDLNYWEFGDGDNEYSENATHEYEKVGDYEVELVVTTNLGCTDTTIVMVKVNDEYTLYAPTAFSPDNDGINDVFFITGNGIDAEEFTLRIYNRWGELIFETQNFNYDNPEEFGWNGRLESGITAEIGVYTWYLVYKDNLDVSHEAKGIVTLIK